MILYEKELDIEKWNCSEFIDLQRFFGKILYKHVTIQVRPEIRK